MLEKLPKMKNVFEKKEFVEEKIHQLIQKAKEFFSHAANYTIRDQELDNSDKTKEDPLKTQAYKKIFELIETGLAHTSYDLKLYSQGEIRIKSFIEGCLKIEGISEDNDLTIDEREEELIEKICKKIFSENQTLEQWEFLASLDSHLTNPELLETLPNSLQSAVALEEISSDEYQNDKSTFHYLFGIYLKEKAKELGILTMEEGKLEIQKNINDMVPVIEWKEFREAVEKLDKKIKNSRRIHKLEIDDDDETN